MRVSSSRSPVGQNKFHVRRGDRLTRRLYARLRLRLLHFQRAPEKRSVAARVCRREFRAEKEYLSRVIDPYEKNHQRSGRAIRARNRTLAEVQAYKVTADAEQRRG